MGKALSDDSICSPVQEHPTPTPGYYVLLGGAQPGLTTSRQELIGWLESFLFQNGPALQLGSL